MSLFDERALRQLIADEVRRVVREELAAQRGVTSPARGYLSIPAAADHTGIHPGTLRRWINSGALPARKAGRVWRLRIEDLESFLARNQAEGEGVIDLAKRAEELLAKAR